MKRIVFFSVALACFFAVVYSQSTISGAFPALGNQQLKQAGLYGFDTYTIDSVRASDKGSFVLSFSPKDYGMGYLADEDEKALIVILAPNENLQLEGEALVFSESVVIKSGMQNQLFGQYATEHPLREQALSAWVFLDRKYNQKWESPVVKAYQVFATPTMYLLDSKREIVLRPNSVRQMDAWVDWFLVQGNR